MPWQMSWPNISGWVYWDKTWTTQIICFKLGSIGGKMIGFTLGPAYGTNIWISDKEWYGFFNYL